MEITVKDGVVSKRTPMRIKLQRFVKLQLLMRRIVFYCKDLGFVETAKKRFRSVNPRMRAIHQEVMALDLSEIMLPIHLIIVHYKPLQTRQNQKH